MFLTKYNPATALDTIWDAFDRDFFRFFDGADEEFRLPSTNINEKEKEYVITMEMPGVSKKNVDVSLDGDSLVVTAKKVDKIESEGLIRKEIRAEKFRRSFQIGSNIDREKIKAKMENGVLKLILPKREDSVGRKIEIA